MSNGVHSVSFMASQGMPNSYQFTGSQQASGGNDAWHTAADLSLTAGQLLIGLQPMGLAEQLAWNGGIEAYRAFVLDHKSITDLGVWGNIAMDTAKNWAITKVVGGVGSFIKGKMAASP